MAITTTLFSQYSTTAEMMTGVKAIIDGYGFFDTTVINTENRKLTCTVDNVDFLVLTFDTSAMKIADITLKSKNNITLSSSAGVSSYRLTGIITTSKAFKFITNTTSDTGCIVGLTKGGKFGAYNKSTTSNIKTISTETTIDPKTQSTNILITGCTVTTIMNMPVTTGADVMQDVYIKYASENDTIGNYTLNGNNYYSDGYVMIAD